MSDDTCTPPVYANPMPVTTEQQMLREALTPRIPLACPLCRRADGHAPTCLVLLAEQAGEWVQEGMASALAVLADTTVPVLDPEERHRQAVAEVVAGWDIGGSR